MEKDENIEILLIEDNPDHAELTQISLNEFRDDFKITLAATGEEGKEMMDRRQFSIVLLDYCLPGSNDGMAVLKQLKKTKYPAPVVVVTGQKDIGLAVEIMKEGAYDYVVKDLSYQDTLPVVIQRTMERHSIVKEKKRLEQELKESNKKLKEMYEVKSEFTSMVSHELRTPLTAIKEGIAIVLDGSAGSISDEQKDFLATAKRNVDRLKRLIDDVLDFSKLEAKKITFRMKENDINEVIKEAVNVQKVVLEEKGLSIKTELDATIPKIKFDQDRINQVITNLLSNAVKFTSKGGVTITTVKKEEENIVEVCIKDTGPGIAEEELPKLFQKFQQLGGPDRRKTGGTGLGLAISKDIVEQHKGKIWAVSEHGMGTEFRFVLPIKREYKILVIDDDRINLDICEKIIKRNGYTAITTEKGFEGIRIAQEEIPDLIVLDMRLEENITGYEIIGRLKSSRDTMHIPILVMSGYKSELDKVRGRAEWALPCISKPFDNDEFILTIKNLLEK